MLAPWKKSYEKPRQHIEKQSRDITLPTKVHIVRAMVFPVVINGYERWTIKKAEHRRIDAFELWCWRRLLRVPWTARRWNLSILEEINPEYSLEGPMLKLKLQHFGHLMWRANSLEITLMLGKIEGRRKRGRQRMRWLDGITDSMDVSLSSSFLYMNEWMKSLSHVWLFATPWTIACQAPVSKGFTRQEYWSGLPFPSPGDLPRLGIEPRSPTLQADALPSEPPGKV